MKPCYLSTLILALIFAFSQLVSIQTMAMTFEGGKTAAINQADMNQMPDCTGMDMSDQEACPHSGGTACCVHISCSPLAMMTSISPSSHVKPLSEQPLWATQDRPSVWIEDPTPPPKKS